jgi:hypothetical protein
MPHEKADAIFVFAGRESRKRFGLQLLRQGVANRIVLSVGRFEWRRFVALGLPSDGGLVELVSTTEPPLRHFFVDVRAEGARCERIPVGRLGTWSEARALGRFVEREGISTLLVVSEKQHLIRCLLCLKLSVPSSSCLIPVPMAESDSGEPPPARFTEAFKLLAYGSFLSFAWIRRLVRSPLRRRPFPDIKTGFTLSQPGLREGEFRPPEAGRVPSPQGATADGRSHD